MLLGSLVATTITNVLTSEQLYDYGWRIPFLLGAVIGVTGLYLRRNMNGDSLFQYEKNHTNTPIKDFWKYHKIDSLKMILISWGFGVSVYIILIFMPTYLHKFIGVPLENELYTHTIALVVMMLIIPMLGFISDRTGQRFMMILGMGGFVVFTFPLFMLFFYNIFIAVLTAMFLFIILEGMLQASIPALLAQMIPKNIRYSGLSISYNVSLALFGGTAPLIGTWLIKITGNIWMPAFYLIAATSISFITLLFMKK